MERQTDRQTDVYREEKYNYLGGGNSEELF